MKFTSRMSVTLLLLTSMPPKVGLAAESLSLEQYLNQVKENHQGLKASALMQSAAVDKSMEAEMILRPMVFANAQQMVDKKETASPATQGTQTTMQSLAVGVGQKMPFGMDAKLSYGLGYGELKGANPQMVPFTNKGFYEGKPTLELSQSLWRNFLGEETSLMLALAKTQGESAQLGEQFKSKMVMLEAELTYLRLVIARETVQVQKDNLDRAIKLRDWNAERVNRELTDKADFLQAEALVNGRKLELQAAKDEESAAQAAFNSLRGKDSSAVSESLETLNFSTVEKIAAPARKGTREDVLMMEKLAQLSESQIAMVDQKYKPTLEAFASLSLNGRDEKLSKSAGESFKGDHPSTTIGLRLNAPLGGEPLNRAKSGYAKDYEAVKLQLDRKKFEVEQDWKDLLAKFEQAKERMKLAELLENSQKERLSHERNRNKVGRATSSQVIFAEQDFATAQFNRIRSEADVLRIVAQLKTFEGRAP